MELTDASQLISPLIDEHRRKAIGRVRTTKKGGFVCAITGHAAGTKLYTYTEPTTISKKGVPGKKTRIVAAAYSLPVLLRGLASALEDHPAAYQFARKRVLAQYGQDNIPMAPQLDEILSNPDRFFGDANWEVWRNVPGAYTLVAHTEKREANKRKVPGDGVPKAAGKKKAAAKKPAQVKAKLAGGSAYVLGTAGTDKSVKSFEDIKTLTAKKRAMLKHSAVTFIADGKFIVDYVPFDADNEKAKQNAWFPAAQGPVLVQPLRNITWTAGAMEVEAE